MNNTKFKGRIFVAVLVVFVATLAAAVPALAQTIIPAGEVSGVWSAAGSPYLIDGDINVPAGQTLTIEPGVEVIFQSWYGLTVNGTLLAEGTVEAPILFTTVDSSPGWLGIRFVNAPDGSRLTYVIVERGKASGAAPLDRGGGIYIENSSPVIRDSTIRDNLAVKYGGGIYLSNSNARLLDNTIINNQAGQGGSAAGGGIFIDAGNPELTGNTIRGNLVYVSGSYSTPSGSGGGVYINRSDPALRYNVISDNEVNGHLNSYARGGGLYLSSSDPDLINNTIAGNTVGTGSGGVYDVDEGGGLYLYQSHPVLVNTILWNDTPQEILFATNGVGSSVTVAYSDVGDGQAGIVDNGNGTINWLGGNINADPVFADAVSGDYQLDAGSLAIDAGTAYFEWEGQVLVDLAPADYIGAAPDMGALEAGGDGGANQPPVAAASAAPDHGSAPLTVQFNSDGSYDPDGTITAYAWDFGDGGSALEANPTYTYNAIGTYQATLTVADDAGATHSDVVPISVVDGTTIWGGDVSGTWTAAGSPYRIESDITVPAGQTLTVEPGVEVIFQSWYGLTVNGTLLAEGTAEAPILFTAVDSSPGWLGIRFVNAPDGSSLARVIVERGKASGAAPLNRGGGIYIENSSPEIRDSTIRDNFAMQYGGGIYLSNSNARLLNNTILNNQAGQGGSAAGGGIFIDTGNPELTGNTIRGNLVYVAGSYSTPSGSGGGVYINRSDPTLRYNVISDNRVDGQGNSYARGGGLYLSGSDPDLVNNTIAGNTVGAGSGGVYDVDEGGGLYLYQSHPVLVNTILWNDTPQEIFVSGSGVASSITAAYSDVQGGQAAIVTNGNATLNALEGNIDADPLFVDAANGDLALSEGSPTIDAGTAFFEWEGRVLVDLAPENYLGNAPDMGAIESPYSGGGGNPPPDELHVHDQTVTRVTYRRNARAQDVVLIADQNDQPIAGATVTAIYSGPNQGQVSGTTGADGTVVLETPWMRKPKGTWCFEITDVTKDGYLYNSGANVVTIQCESN